MHLQARATMKSKRYLFQKPSYRLPIDTISGKSYKVYFSQSQLHNNRELTYFVLLGHTKLIICFWFPAWSIFCSVVAQSQD